MHKPMTNMTSYGKYNHQQKDGICRDFIHAW